MESFGFSALLIALAEIGDKTQLLSLLLALRFRRAAPILWGIALATLANHALAAVVGVWMSDLVPNDVLRWVLGLSFMLLAYWTLKEERLATPGMRAVGCRGAFLVTLVSFFLAEMGDKTQLATAALAARFDMPAAVIAGTVVGMMAVNGPTVLLGALAAQRIPVHAIRLLAATLLGLLGGVILLSGVFA